MTNAPLSIILIPTNVEYVAQMEEEAGLRLMSVTSISMIPHLKPFQLKLEMTQHILHVSHVPSITMQTRFNVQYVKTQLLLSTLFSASMRRSIKIKQSSVVEIASLSFPALQVQLVTPVISVNQIIVRIVGVARVNQAGRRPLKATVENLTMLIKL